MQNILVTGGAGYIGSHAVRALVDAGYGVTVLDNLAKGHVEAIPAGVRFIQMDLGDAAGLRELFVREKFDAVMHFAGVLEVGESMREPARYFETNVVYGVNLLEAMRVAGVRTIIFSSTAAVYEAPRVAGAGISEDAVLNPTNFYGQSKLFFENILRKYEYFYGFKFCALRYFNAAGADASAEIGQDYEPATHVVPRVLQYALGKISDFKIFGDDFETPDGTCVRDYIHVTDLVDAHLLALKYLFSGGASTIFNLGNGRGFSVREVIEMARRVTGLDLSVLVGSRREGDPAVLVADSTKAQQILGWKPKFFSLKDIVGSAWKWHKSHPNGYAVMGASGRVDLVGGDAAGNSAEERKHKRFGGKNKNQINKTAAKSTKA